MKLESMESSGANAKPIKSFGGFISSSQCDINTSSLPEDYSSQTHTLAVSDCNTGGGMPYSSRRNSLKGCDSVMGSVEIQQPVATHFHPFFTAEDIGRNSQTPANARPNATSAPVSISDSSCRLNSASMGSPDLSSNNHCYLERNNNRTIRYSPEPLHDNNRLNISNSSSFHYQARQHFSSNTNNIDLTANSFQAIRSPIEQARYAPPVDSPRDVESRRFTQSLSNSPSYIPSLDANGNDIPPAIPRLVGMGPQQGRWHYGHDQQRFEPTAAEQLSSGARCDGRMEFGIHDGRF